MFGLMQPRQIQATWKMSKASVIKEVKSIIHLSCRSQGTHWSQRQDRLLRLVQWDMGGAESRQFSNRTQNRRLRVRSWKVTDMT